MVNSTIPHEINLGPVVSSQPAGTLGTFSGIFHSISKLLAVASGAGAAISFIVTSVRKAMRPDRLWYSGRAVAESAKSMAWR